MVSTGLLPFLALAILNYKINRRMVATVNRARRAGEFLKARWTDLVLIDWSRLETIK